MLLLLEFPDDRGESPAQKTQSMRPRRGGSDGKTPELPRGGGPEVSPPGNRGCFSVPHSVSRLVLRVGSCHHDLCPGPQVSTRRPWKSLPASQVLTDREDRCPTPRLAVACPCLRISSFRGLSGRSSCLAGHLLTAVSCALHAGSAGGRSQPGGGAPHRALRSSPAGS